jgi:hypothetical protein
MNPIDSDPSAAAHAVDAPLSPQPGTVAYTKRTTPDGNIVYQPVIGEAYSG